MNGQDNEKEFKPTESALKKQAIKIMVQIPYDNYYINKKYLKSYGPPCWQGYSKIFISHTALGSKNGNDPTRKQPGRMHQE